MSMVPPKDAVTLDFVGVGPHDEDLCGSGCSGVCTCVCADCGQQRTKRMKSLVDSGQLPMREILVLRSPTRLPAEDKQRIYKQLEAAFKRRSPCLFFEGLEVFNVRVPVLDPDPEPEPKDEDAPFKRRVRAMEIID